MDSAIVQGQFFWLVLGIQIKFLLSENTSKILYCQAALKKIQLKQLLWRDPIRQHPLPAIADYKLLQDKVSLCQKSLLKFYFLLKKPKCYYHPKSEGCTLTFQPH